MTEPDIRFDGEGRLSVGFGPMGDDWREPACCICGEPVQWVLDMHSFRYEAGRYEMGHAWCLWNPAGFDVAKRRALGRTG